MLSDEGEKENDIEKCVSWIICYENGKKKKKIVCHAIPTKWTVAWK